MHVLGVQVAQLRSRAPLRIQNLRVNNVEIPNSKRIEYSLQYIYGIGSTTAKAILRDTVRAQRQRQRQRWRQLAAALALVARSSCSAPALVRRRSSVCVCVERLPRCLLQRCTE